jgi:hypothetical protein
MRYNNWYYISHLYTVGQKGIISFISTETGLI